MKWLYRILLALVGVALVAGVYNVTRKRPLDVDVATVTRAPFEQTVVDDGIARVRERYTVSAPVAGTLARIELHEGDMVEPGTVLAFEKPWFIDGVGGFIIEDPVLITGTGCEVMAPLSRDLLRIG